MRDTAIVERLREIAARENITILYACESGSRGWQFASTDSDYDVRFVYLRPLDWYLSIHEKRDVIEEPITNALDFLGWDLRKTLQLFQRSNPRLLEWISSPIVYVPAAPVIEEVWALAPAYFSPFTCGLHHIKTARHYFANALVGERMHVKKIFYALRSSLILKWIEETGAISPMSFWAKVERLIADPILLDAIEQLFSAKQQSREQALIPRIPALEEFVQAEIAHQSETYLTFPHNFGPDAPLDAIFRNAFGATVQWPSTQPSTH